MDAGWGGGPSLNLAVSFRGRRTREIPFRKSSLRAGRQDRALPHLLAGWLMSLTVVNVTRASSASQDFVTALSILLRGTVHEKLRWTFNLYDINKDGYINKEVSEPEPGARGSYKDGI